MGIEDVVQTKIRENPELIDSLGGANGSNFKRVIEFCKVSINPIREVGKTGEIKFDYTDEEFVENVLILCKEFYFGSESKYLRPIFKEKSSPNENILKFLNEVVLEPTTTLTCMEITKDRYEVRKSEKFKNIGDHFLEKEKNPIDALRLMCYLLEKYHKPKDDYSCDFTFLKRTFKDNDQDYIAWFSDSIWRNLYHCVNTCKFNGDYEMRAAMLDCADEHIHYLLVSPRITGEGERKKKTQNAPAEIIAILVDAEEVDKKGNKTGNKYLVIEGVFGVSWFKPESEKTIDDDTETDKKMPDEIIDEAFSKEEVRLRDFLYGLVYESVKEMAAKTKRGLFVNSSFSSHYPPQGPTHFVNYYSGRRNKDEKTKEGYYLVLTSKEVKTRDGIKWKRVFKYKQNMPAKEKDYSDIYLIKEISPEVDRLFTRYRRLNTWHDWTRYLRELEEKRRK